MRQPVFMTAYWSRKKKIKMLRRVTFRERRILSLESRGHITWSRAIRSRDVTLSRDTVTSRGKCQRSPIASGVASLFKTTHEPTKTILCCVTLYVPFKRVERKQKTSHCNEKAIAVTRSGYNSRSSGANDDATFSIKKTHGTLNLNYKM